MLAMIPRQFKSSEHSLSDRQRVLLNNSGCELICTDVHLYLSRYRLVTIYRPLNSSYLNKFDLPEKTRSLKILIESLAHPHYSTIVLGNFNLLHINWAVNDFILDNVHDVIFECFNSMGFTQFVNVATHSSMQSDNILDLILSNDSTCIDVHNISAPLGSSHHSIVNFSITAVSMIRAILKVLNFHLVLKQLNCIFMIGQLQIITQ